MAKMSHNRVVKLDLTDARVLKQLAADRDVSIAAAFRQYCRPSVSEARERLRLRNGEARTQWPPVD